jgi:hypothetical protein
VIILHILHSSSTVHTTHSFLPLHHDHWHSRLETFISFTNGGEWRGSGRATLHSLISHDLSCLVSWDAKQVSSVLAHRNSLLLAVNGLCICVFRHMCCVRVTVKSWCASSLFYVKSGRGVTSEVFWFHVRWHDVCWTRVKGAIVDNMGLREGRHYWLFNAAACEGSTSAFFGVLIWGKDNTAAGWSEGRINHVNGRFGCGMEQRAVVSIIYYYFRSQCIMFILLYYMVFLVGATPTLSVFDHASSKPVSSDFHHGKTTCLRVTSGLLGELCEEVFLFSRHF